MPNGDGVNRKNHFARLPARRFDAIVSSQYQHADFLKEGMP
jgi:hypothetical protein